MLELAEAVRDASEARRSTSPRRRSRTRELQGVEPSGRSSDFGFAPECHRRRHRGGAAADRGRTHPGHHVAAFSNHDSLRPYLIQEVTPFGREVYVAHELAPHRSTDEPNGRALDPGRRRRRRPRRRLLRQRLRLAPVRRMYVVPNHRRGSSAPGTGTVRTQVVTVAPGRCARLRVAIDDWESPSPDLEVSPLRALGAEPEGARHPRRVRERLHDPDRRRGRAFFSSATLEESHGDDVRFPRAIGIRGRSRSAELPELTVIIPTQNEAPVLEACLASLHRVLLPAITTEVVSSTTAASTARSTRRAQLSRRFPVLHIASSALARPTRASARCCGSAIAHAAGRFFAVLAPDGTDPLELIPAMVQELRAGRQIVICSRYRPTTGSAFAAFRLYQRIYRRAIKLLLGREITDSTNGFRAFDRCSRRLSAWLEPLQRLPGADVQGDACRRRRRVPGGPALRGQAPAPRSSSSRSRSPGMRPSSAAGLHRLGIRWF